MEPYSEDPHLCWVARLLGLTSLLLSICSTVVQSSGKYGSEVQNSRFVHMQGIQGGSVLFHIVKKQEADPEEVSWGFGPELNYRVLLRVHRGADTPTWVSLQDKYQQRVQVPNVTSLKIENLTSEDSGQYRARASFTGGMELNQVFLLTVYEPVILPEILVKSSSITPGLCNVTLECRDPGKRKDLKVTWESEGLPRELEWSGTPGPAPSSWSLTVNLSLSQPNANLTCVVSNHADKKTATVDFAQVCFSGSQEQTIAGLLEGILCGVVAVLFFLGAGLYFWKTYKKERNTETGRGAALQEDHRNQDDGDWAEPSQEEYQQGMYQPSGPAPPRNV
ncbi:SLAM family member 9-like isoform X3 [Bos indicus]|uniref:SLAM family member 9-like isoform X3 n=1 Tax=Bos indicus TaxID=9915 RepID=A0ABM4RXW4_BOSIN